MPDKAQRHIENWQSGTLSLSKWANWGGAQCTVVQERLQIASTTAAGYYGLDSKDHVDLVGSSVSTELVSAGNQGLASFEVYPVVLIPTDDSNDQLAWLIAGNTLLPFYKVNGSNTFVGPSDAYNSSVHKFFRIRENGGNVYWDYSTDGMSWINYASVATPSMTISSMLIDIFIGTWQVEGSTTTGVFDNINCISKQRPGNLGRIVRVGNNMSRSESAT